MYTGNVCILCLPVKQDLAKIQTLLVKADFRLDSITNDAKDYRLWVVFHTAYDSVIEASS